jgi:hypothetical protein
MQRREVAMAAMATSIPVATAAAGANNISIGLSTSASNSIGTTALASSTGDLQNGRTWRFCQCFGDKSDTVDVAEGMHFFPAVERKQTCFSQLTDILPS